MKTLGVDLAASTKKTAAAVVEWNGGSARLLSVSLDVDDAAIVRLFGATDMAGIDCPVAGRTRSCPLLPAISPAPRALSWIMMESRAGGSWLTGTRTASSRPGPG